MEPPGLARSSEGCFNRGNSTKNVPFLEAGRQLWILKFQCSYFPGHLCVMPSPGLLLEWNEVTSQLGETYTHDLRRLSCQLWQCFGEQSFPDTLVLNHYYKHIAHPLHSPTRAPMMYSYCDCIWRSPEGENSLRWRVTQTSSFSCHFLSKSKSIGPFRGTKTNPEIWSCVLALYV